MQLEEILLDERSGAQELLLRAVHWLQQTPKALLDHERAVTLELLRTARPVMSGFTFLAERLDVDSDEDDATLLKGIADDIRSADVRAANRFAEKIREISPCSIVTISRSSTVLHGLRIAEDHVVELHVLESHPGGEGRQLAEDAEEFCRGVLLHPDEVLRDAAEMADVGVIGADTVFADGGVLNKVLSIPLAEALKELGKPLYVLATSWKGSTQTSDKYTIEGTDAELFEIVPPELVTEVLDDDGR